MQRLMVSGNGRYLVTADGEAFFWLADTAWELLHRATYADACHYLDVRASQGFNVVQAVVLAELDGLGTPNAGGALPLIDGDPERPNEQYFAFVDSVISAAASRGVYMALLPSWGDKVNKRYDWAVGPEVFTEENAYGYARFLALRYVGYSSIVWVLGGDRNPDERAVAIWRAMARGLLSVDPAALISFHPQPMDGGSSSRWFHHESWLGFNMLQTGHDRGTAVDEIVSRDYGLAPVKPVLNGEPTYEAHPISFKVSEGYSTDADIRRDAYLSVFAGACGHTYGCHSVWQWYDGVSGPGVNFPLLSWREALGLAGAGQMRHLLSLRLPGLAPCGELCEGAMRSDDGRYACVYTATGGRLIVNGDVLVGEHLRVCWMSPKDGCRTVAYVVDRVPLLEFVTPNSGPGCDWVLIIESL